MIQLLQYAARRDVSDVLLKCLPHSTCGIKVRVQHSQRIEEGKLLE